MCFFCSPTRNSKKEKNWTLNHFRCPFNNWNEFIIQMRWDFRKRFAYAANLDVSAAVAFSKNNFFQIFENTSIVATANFSKQCVAEVFDKQWNMNILFMIWPILTVSKKGNSSFFMVTILFPFSFRESSLKRELNLFLNLKQHFQLELDGLCCVVCCCCKSMNNKKQGGDYFPLFSCQLFELKLSLHLRIVLKQTQKNLNYQFSNIFISICD